MTTPDGVQNVYTYDDAGNRLTKTSTVDGISAVTEYTYDEQNRLLQTKTYVVGDTTEVYTYFGYDNNGNQIAKWTQTIGTTGTADSVTLSELGVNANDDTALYEFDNFNRLVSIYQGDTTIENTYRGDGKNISRTTDGEITYYVYDGNTVILELDSDNEETARNVYGRNLVTRETSDGVVVYSYNGHSDVIAICNLDNEALIVYEYDEFGNVTLETVVDEEFANFDNPYRYAGYEYIEEVKLYDLNARYYNPEIARFLSADPYYNLGNRVIGLYEINVPEFRSIIQATVLYAYCGNNPILFKDFAGYAEYYIDGETPEFQFDHTFPYDSSKKAKFADYVSYAKWRSLGFGSNFAPWLEDASKAYNHYLNGTGTDLEIDYEKAYKEDSYIKECIDSEIEVIKSKIIEVYDNDNDQTSFEMTGEIFGIENGTTENWQKTIGAHQVYANAKVSINPETNVANVAITFYMEDMYNFNPGMQDIATGTPDDVNGRFSELGWAKEFKTYGSMEKVISWNLKDGSVVSNKRGGFDR